MSQSYAFEIAVAAGNFPRLIDALGEHLIEADHLRLLQAQPANGLEDLSRVPPSREEREYAPAGTFLFTLSFPADSVLEAFALEHTDVPQPVRSHVQVGYVWTDFSLREDRIIASLATSTHSITEVFRESASVLGVITAIATQADAITVHGIDEWGDSELLWPLPDAVPVVCCGDGNTQASFYVRMFAECKDDEQATAITAALLQRLAEFSPILESAPSRYWKMPNLYEFSFSLNPQTLEMFHKLVSTPATGWHHAGEHPNWWSVWNREEAAVFLLPEIVWAEVDIKLPESPE